jgi:D-alanyl-lipoteichoic acid acyltransferase DltB (MBOAT superfamily)
MLFNSLIFLLAFAPVTFGVFFALGRFNAGPRAVTLWLALTSLAFYAWWLPKHTAILLASIVLNYLLGRWIVRAGPATSLQARRVLTLAVVLNLSALVYYKYAGFFVSTASTLLGQEWTVPSIVLPLGISFFTFTQLAYLVDTYQGKVKESNYLRYVLFVTYFPHLIAGPVIHHKDVMPQFERADAGRWCSANVAAGAAFFMLGLFKKVFIADSLVPYVTPVFDGGAAPALLHAWGGALAYSFQLYFDFSGYSDMAIGLSLALNVRLPYNFNSPYKALSIADFWKRWHISLSTFLRDYLYIPLGGNRSGPVRRYTNLLLTMLIGGMWHGAGWTFIVWGGLHGVYLVINHAWRHVRDGLPRPVGAAERTVAWALTFLAVVVAWVFFRAHDFASAWAVVAGMAGVHGTGSFVLQLPDSQTLDYLPLFGALAVLLFVVARMPNSQQMVARWLVDEPEHAAAHPGRGGTVTWLRPPLWIAIAWGVVAAVGLMHVSQPTQFLYFNF